jgi:hypothetical protein
MPPQRADDAERHAGVADRRAGLDRPAVALTGDAHRPANGLCDRVERQALLVRATIAEALDLGIDDARIDRDDDVVAESEGWGRSGRAGPEEHPRRCTPKRRPSRGCATAGAFVRWAICMNASSANRPRPDLDGSNPRRSLFRATRSQTALLAKTSHSPRAGSRPFPRVAGIPYAEVYPRGLEA